MLSPLSLLTGPELVYFANHRLASSLVEEVFSLASGYPQGHLGCKEVTEFHLEKVCFEYRVLLR